MCWATDHYSILKLYVTARQAGVFAFMWLSSTFYIKHPKSFSSQIEDIGVQCLSRIQKSQPRARCSLLLPEGSSLLHLTRGFSTWSVYRSPNCLATRQPESRYTVYGFFCVPPNQNGSSGYPLLESTVFLAHNSHAGLWDHVHRLEAARKIQKFVSMYCEDRASRITGCELMCKYSLKWILVWISARCIYVNKFPVPNKSIATKKSPNVGIQEFDSSGQGAMVFSKPLME